MDSFFKLLDIKNEDKNGKRIEIPAIQRGLVWSAKQIEFLWDSIFRGFPVGGFVVAEHDNTYDLLDGQQRFRAISMAFEEPTEAESQVLWWDINPDKKTTTRRFFLKVINMAQPWGYGNDDNCSPLSASDRRDALSSFFKDSDFNVYKDDFCISETYPYVSCFPIPLSFFLNVALSGNNKDDLIAKIKTLPVCWQEKYWNEENQKYLTDNYSRLMKDVERILQYTIPFSVLSQSAIELEENENENREETNVEILFNRLGSMGTQITKEELAYSAIKSYWDKKTTETIEELSRGFLPPNILIMIAFRLVLTGQEDEKFHRELSIPQIRKTAKEKEFREKIVNFCTNGEARRITQILKDEITSQQIPKHLVLKIGKEIPDVFMLAMFIIMRFGNQPDFCSFNIPGLLLLFLWFGERKCITQSVDYIFSVIKSKQNVCELTECFSKAIFDMMRFGWISTIYSPEETEYYLSLENSLQNGIDENDPVGNSISRLLWNRSLLLYSQRQFINDNYCKFDPLDSRRWKDDNCPWDYDHILPQSWVYKQKGVKQTFKFWEYTIGNLAAIPYEVNRSKNDNSDYSFYDNHCEELLFDDRVKSFCKESTIDEEMGRVFAKIVSGRFIRIYRDCYHSFSNLLSAGGSDESRKRKHYFVKLKNSLGIMENELKARFVLFSREFDIVNNVDWDRQWISFEYDVNDYCVASITSFKESKEDRWEVGLRKHPSILSTNDDWRKKNMEILKKIENCTNPKLEEEWGQGWWYLEKDVSSYEEAEKDFKTIIEIIKEL